MTNARTILSDTTDQKIRAFTPIHHDLVDRLTRTCDRITQAHGISTADDTTRKLAA
ncbi:hypothetical protein [Yoonia sp. SS1-5]|uniref:Uncharacterized protein n=1 Tax=Yoonia rhodophyticola TaxID=3137370 RepID=A0AAN0ME56_9RHOB